MLENQTPAKPPAPAPKPEVKPKVAPVIPVEVREKLFKAQAELLASQTALEHAQQAAQAKTAAFQVEVKKAQETCGADYSVNLDQVGEVVCTENPAAPKAPEKK
jgi:hypothetical protein